MTASRALLAVGLTLATACGRVEGPPDETASRCGAALSDADAVLAEAARPRPELGDWHVDPVLGGCLARVSDHAALGAGDAQALPDRQAWNATQDRVLLRAGRVLDAERFGPVAQAGSEVAVWSALDPSLIYVALGNELVARDLDAGSTRTIAQFSEYQALTALSDPSSDDRLAAAVGRRPDGVYEVFSVELATGKKSATEPGPVDAVHRGFEPRRVMLSPSARSVIVQWPDAGEHPRGVEAFDAEMAWRGRLGPGGGAADVARDADGNEWYVEVAASSSGLALQKRKLPDGEPQQLLDLDGFHNVRISCRAAAAAGLCAISTHRDPLGGWQPFENEVFVISLGDSRVERLAHHHSDPGFVAAQPVQSCETSPDSVLANASLSRDARHVLFTSNWNAHCFGELYLVQR